MITIKKSIAVTVMLALSLIFGVICSDVISVSAAQTVSVDIVSFNRGAQENLRSSELLEAKVYGYSGNVRELTYKWTSTLGTYLYVYNSHNMYGINNTDGEIEIYNTSKGLYGLENMQGRNYDQTFTGSGFAWAAVYGSNVSSSDLVGTITVEVYDKNGNLLASDTHEGTRTQSGSSEQTTYTNHGIVQSDFADDIRQVHFGLFEGDSKNIKILLGESSIVHTICADCTVSNAEIISGAGIIELESEELNEWHINSVSLPSSVEAKVKITVEKAGCKFHQNLKATSEVGVYVYKKPTVTSTSTKIMLGNLDDRCTYYIGGVKGVRETVDGEGYVVFDNLAPNTNYQVEVVGQTSDSKPVYAYIYETTKPAHIGTVKVFLNGSYDTSTATATGTLVNIEDMIEDAETLYLRYEDSELYFPLSTNETGVYYSTLSDGKYNLYYSKANSDEKISLGDQYLVINGASRTRDLFFNSVTYDANGGDAEIPTEYYLVNSKVLVSDVVPVKTGFLFSHWSCQSGHEHKAGDVLTEALGQEYNLVAQYIAANDVYVNIVIKHQNGDRYDNDPDMHNIEFTIDQRFEDSGDYTELVKRSITWDGWSFYNKGDYFASYSFNETSYYATAPTLVDVERYAQYTITTHKSKYRITSIEHFGYENGDHSLTVYLTYEPDSFDFRFNVELDEESMNASDDLKPAAVNVKVTSWEDPADVYGDEVMWWHITQQHDTYARVALDENGKGSSTFPVWMATTDKSSPIYYRIEVVSYETANGTIIPAINKDGKNEIYHTEFNRYSAKVNVDGGYTPAGSTLSGAYYSSASNAQEGIVTAVVTIDVFDVTFDPNGGMLGGSTENTVLNYQIGIPDLNNYTPTKAGGYVFDGWYIADENGNITNEKAVSDTIIFKDTTLIAKWKEPLTIKGQLAAAGTYTLDNGATHEIHDYDRLDSVLVLLQRIAPNGYAETIKYADVTLTFNGDYGIGEYEFTGLQDDGHQYRIKVAVADYHAHYNNDSTGIAAGNYSEYKEEVAANYYLAAFLDDSDTSVANVHTYLHFMPETFELKYEVNSAYIGEGLAPTDAEVLVLYDTGAHIDPQHWDVISQMIFGDKAIGSVFAFENSIASGSHAVWEMQSSTNKAYDYSIRVNSLTLGGEKVSYNETSLPFYIAYNGSARYSDLSKEQTQLLTATLIPRRYVLTFDMGNLPDGTIVNGMEEYASLDDTFVDDFYWSHGAAISATPTAEGYTFVGWFDADGNSMSAVSADTAKNVTAYAKWVPIGTFDIIADAGYYAETKDGSEKSGVIAFSAHLNEYVELGSRIKNFGIYIYNDAAEQKAQTQSADITQLVADEGWYYTIISNISEENMDKRVLAAAFAVIDIDGNPETTDDIKTVLGDFVSESVANINKWLGSTNPYSITKSE